MAKTKSKKTYIAPDDITPEREDSESDSGGMMLDNESIRLIYKALKSYKPTEEEKHLHGIMLEEFEGLLDVDYIDIPTK